MSEKQRESSGEVALTVRRFFLFFFFWLEAVSIALFENLGGNMGREIIVATWVKQRTSS